MWTPKRILMLVACFVVFFVAYGAYSATYFGAIDSLPPLPEAYKQRRTEGGDESTSPPPPPEPKINEKLKMAFGPGCPETKWSIKLDLNAKSMVICSEHCEFEGGRLKLVPISVALFGKDKGDGKYIEINTVRAKTAYLTFDRPVNSPNEVNGRKIEQMELIENIEIVNNRRTPGRDDDLTVNMQTGPLYYNEPRHFVWTKDNITLVDRQSKPDPVEVRGRGMEMELLTQAPPGKAGTPPAAKNKGENITGVKRIVLHSDVVMHLYSAPGAGVMGTSKKTEPPKAPRSTAEPAESVKKEHIVVQTQGRFQYDFLKDYDLATFDVPTGEAGAHLPQDVTVTRHHVREAGTDELVCQHLELRLRHRDSSAQPAKQGSDTDQGGLEVETAHATAGARQVVLKSDPEKLTAIGNDFFYDSFKKQSVLKGDSEIEVERDGSVMHAREMQMQEMKPPPGSPPGAEGYQHVIALGPGSIHMGSKGSEKKTTHAYWNERLTSTRDGPHDLLVLTGAARFVDDEHEQSLQAEVLKVWLLGEDKNKKAAKPAAAAAAPGNGAAAGPVFGGEQGRKPHHLEATGNVVAHSRDLNIHDTSRLVTWFKDVDQLPGSPQQDSRPAPAPRQDPRPAAPAPMPPRGAWVPASRSTSGVVPAAYQVESPVPATPALLGAPVAPTTGMKEAPPPAPPPRPIDLSAKQVDAWVLRCGDKNQLDEMYSEGNVHVRQEPAKPDENPVDIRGDKLQMKSHPDGSELIVNGDLAQLQMDKIYIIGPEVNIDQATNRAWVHGVGAMKMESATNFQGAKLDKTVPLTVHWNSEMFFNGEYAEFLGGIQAEQQNARLASERLQVYFDKVVSLKQGNRGEPAKVRNLLADNHVRVEDSTFDTRGLLVKFQQITGTLLQMFTLAADETSPRDTQGKPKDCNQVTVSGPGDVRILQPGSTDPAVSPGRTTTAKPGGPVTGTPVSVARGAGPDHRPVPGKKPDEEMKMTYVHFLHRMDANSKTNTAKFWGSVRLLNFPCDNPREEIDIDAIIGRELPPGVLFMSADYLEVLDQPDNGKSNQQMKARDHVRVQGKEFMAEANEMSYEEQKDLVIFTGTKDNPAVLIKQEYKGGPLQTMRAQKIFYWRSTGQAKADGTESLRE